MFWYCRQHVCERARDTHTAVKVFYPFCRQTSHMLEDFPPLPTCVFFTLHVSYVVEFFLRAVGRKSELARFFHLCLPFSVYMLNVCFFERSCCLRVGGCRIGAGFFFNLKAFDGKSIEAGTDT